VELKQIIIGGSNYLKGTTTEEQFKKYNICKTCSEALPSNIFKHITDNEFSEIEGKRCNNCGCSLSLKLRSNSKCPLNKW